MKNAGCYFVFWISCVAAVRFGLHAKNGKILDGNEQVVRLRGVSKSGTEYACRQGWGIFDGPVDDPAISAMVSWNISVVRVPLNQDCWLNIHNVAPQWSGQNYIDAIYDFISRLNNHGMNVIVELHWSSPGNQEANQQQPMPDKDHSIDFWQNVASLFKNNTSIIFDLFNEPFPDNNAWDSDAGWTCWRNGGYCPGVNYDSAGMQDLVNTIRSTGATNLLMLGGITYSNCLSRWLAYRPSDPLDNMAASWHSYNFNHCIDSTCWEQTVGQVIEQYPVIVGETGENDCSTGYVNPLFDWLDARGLSYLGWTWNTWDCRSGPALISDYSGTPTPYGIALKQRLTT